MDISWALALVPAIGGGLGAYFGSYLRKKGENLATHEDIDKLVDQVKAVTTATKEIEAKISDNVWDRQRRWELRRDALFEVTRKMGIAEDALNAMFAVYQTNKNSASPDDPRRIQRAIEAYENWNTAASALEGSIMLVELVCDAAVYQQVRAFNVFGRQLAISIGQGHPEAYTQSEAELVAKTNAAISAIRKEIENRK